MIVAFPLFPGITQLDMTGPAQVLSRAPDAELYTVAASRDPVRTGCGFELLPSACFDDLAAVDILCVPGGLGTLQAMQDGALIGWLAQTGETAAWVTSVCTGSLLLGAAGLLKGYRATSHWASVDQLACFGAIPVRERVVFDRNRVSGGGVTAGIDFALTLLAEIAGEETAKRVQLSLEYNPAPPFDAGSPDRADAQTRNAVLALTEKIAPDRDAQVRAIAARLGFQDQ